MRNSCRSSFSLFVIQILIFHQFFVLRIIQSYKLVIVLSSAINSLSNKCLLCIVMHFLVMLHRKYIPCHILDAVNLSSIDWRKNREPSSGKKLPIYIFVFISHVISIVSKQFLHFRINNEVTVWSVLM
jgi:hypothetical protein